MTHDSPLIVQGLFSYQIGGSERVGADLAIEFKRRGYRVICFAFYDSDGPIRSELESHGISCLDLNYERRPRFVRRFLYQLEMYRFLRKHKVKSLLVHHATALVICGVPARLARVKRVVMVEHAIHQLRERPNYRRSATRYLRYADVITGVDQGIVDYFRTEMHVRSDSLRYIPNGVRLKAPDLAMRNEIRKRLGIPDACFLLLSVGRLQPVKDFGTLLDAASRLPDEIKSGTRILIAGDGPERSHLQQRLIDLGLSDTVQLLGARSDVSQLLMAADAFIMTSITEGQPMALIEAMAAGLPCIATSVGGIPSLLGEGIGLLVPPRDPQIIAQSITRVSKDFELRNTLGQRGRALVAEKHNLESISDTYLACLGLPPGYASNSTAENSI